MSVVDKIIIACLCIHFVFAVIYLLYQFEVWDLSLIHI